MKKVTFTAAEMNDKLVVAASSDLVDQATFNAVVAEMYGKKFEIGESRKSFHAWLVKGRRKNTNA